MKNKNFTKIISLAVAVFLLITASINDFAYAISVTPAMQSAVANTDSLKNFSIDNNVISYNLGKITSATNCNSNTVVVNIQDFHCNPSVQKNISDIISSLVKKYNINSVYVEGGYGNINTKWLSDIKDENIKTQLIKVLLENGSLTGAEYFSATNPSSNIKIYGIEKESVYKENFERLQNIFSNKKKYEQIIKTFEKDLTFLQNKYFDTGNRKFNNILKKYRNGQIETRKFYKILLRYVQKYNNSTNSVYGTLLPIKIKDYPNIYTYMMLGEYEKNIKFTKITVEIKEILAVLKTTLSYDQYSQIIKNSNNLKDIPELVSILNALPEDFRNNNFSSEMKNFINYVEISKQINPVKLVEEERILVENLRLALSKNEAEIAISFLSDFFSYFTDYLKTSITADNYRYFLSKFDKFQRLWDKYTYYNQINKYKKEFDILDAYYKTNVQRDYLFLENIEKTDILKSGTNGKRDNNYATILEKAKNIILIVTGGFHSEGLANVVTKNNISYMVITPNVKGNVDFANTRYAQLLQAPLTDISNQAFQLPLLSNGERLNVVYEGLKQLNIQPTQENIEILNKTANEIISNLTGRSTKYANTFEIHEGLIHVNKHKFFDMQNLLKLTIKEHINFINPKNYTDETFSFMKKFASDSNGEIWEISQLPYEIKEQLRDIGYSEYLPEFLQKAYYNIGKKIKPAKEYKLSASNCPFMIKFPNGKIVLISREMDDDNEKYYIIDENFSWDIETNKKQKRDNNPKKTLIENLEKQDYAKDNNGNSVIWLTEKKDNNEMFIAANSDVEFIDLTEINIDIPIYDNDSSYAQTQMDKDLISVLKETNNEYKQNSNMVNASEIEDIDKLDDNQVVFICLQDFIDAQSKKKKRIEEYVKYAIENNKPLIIYPNLYAAHAKLSNADLRFLFKIAGDRFVDFSDFYVSTVSSYIIEPMDFNGINEYNQNSFRKYLEELLKYSLKEILKNTLVHGNLSELDKPIVINFDKNNPQIDVLNLNSNKEENIYRKLITFVTDLRGFGRGLSEIKEGFSKLYDKYPKILKDNKWQYSDNFKDENRNISCASLKLNSKEIKENNDNPNIIYRGKADRPFILKKYENEMLLIINSHNFQITVKNNKIQHDEPTYFYPWAYGLEVKKDKDDIIIEKVMDLPENIKIFPLTEFSPLNFSTDVLDKLSKKYFVDEEKVENIESNNYETIYLEDFIRTDVNKIMDMWNKFDKNIKDGKPIKIFPLRNYNNKKVVSEISEQDYDKFVQLYIMLNSVISRFCDNYRDKILDNKEFSNLDDKTKTALKKELRYDLVEILKNAIVHGNNLDLSKPVTLEFDKDNFQINILNNYSQEETNFTLQCLSAFSGLSGFGLGIKNMSGEDKLFKYFDNFDEERIESRASLKLKDKGNYLKIDKTKLKNTDYYREISERILEIFERNNIDVNENSKALNFIIPLILNNENITQKDLEKLNGTKTEIAELILEAMDAKLNDVNANRNIFNRLKEIEVVLEIEEQSKTTSYVSFKVFEFLGDEFWDPNEYKLLVNTKDDTIYGESENISYDEFKKFNKNYKVKNIHVLDYANIKTRDISELFFEKEAENLQDKINTNDINKLGLTKEAIKIISLNKYPNSPNKTIQDTANYLVDGNAVALFPPLHNLDLQNINSFEELKYMFDVVRTVLWDFCEDLNKEFISQGIIKDDDYTNLFDLDVVLNESLKNAFVHGGNLKTNQPIYLYIKDNRFYVSNIVDKTNTATAKQKSAATMAGLCGFHRGINTLKQSASLDYINKEENSIYTVSFKPNLNITKNVYHTDEDKYIGKYGSLEDTIFMIELPENGKYNCKYIYVQPVKGKLTVTAIDNEDQINNSNDNLSYLKNNLKEYGIEDFKEYKDQFEIKLKDDVKIFNLSKKYFNENTEKTDEIIEFEKNLQNRKNQIQLGDAIKQNESFFKSLGIDTSKEIINISDTNLSQIKDIDNKNVVLNLQDFNMKENKELLDENIRYCVEKNVPIILYPSLNKDIKNMSYSDLRMLFVMTNHKLTNFCNNYYGKALVENWKTKETFKKYIKFSFFEMLKNAFVHGNNADLTLPIIIKPGKDKIEIINDNTQNKKIKDNKKFNLLWKFLAIVGEFHGQGLGIERMKEFEELIIYSDNNINKTQNDNLWIASIEKNKEFIDLYFEKDIENETINTDDKNSDIIYKGAFDNFFVIDAPGKDPVFARFHRGSFNTTDYIIEAKGAKVNKNLEKLQFGQYGLKLEKSSDGKEITLTKDANFKEGTNVIGIPVRYDNLNKKSNLSSKEIEKQNEANKQFFNDLNINISNKDEYEIIHLQDLSSDLEYKIRAAVNNGKALIVYPYLYEDFKVALQNKDYAKLYFLFKELGNDIHLLDFTNTYADIVTNNFFDEFNLNLKTSVKEVLKNSIIHGNNMNLSLPIVIKFDKENSQIDIFNQNIKEEPNKILQTIVVAADWAGFGEGIEKMKSFNTLEYSDNNNNGKRKPNDKIWQTTLKKKKDFIKEIKNELTSKIDVDDKVMEYLITDIIDIKDEKLLEISKEEKSTILKMLLDELEKAAFNLQRLPSKMDVLKNIKIIVEKNDGSTIVLTLFANRLTIYAQNGDFVNYKYLDGQTENDLIENVKNIHIACIDDEGYDYYKEQYETKLKNYDNNAVTIMLQKNYPSAEIINKMGFNEKDLVSLKLDEFIKNNDTFKEKLFENLQDGKLIALFPYSIPEISAEDLIFNNKYINTEFFKEIAFYLAKKTRENSDEYFSADYGYDILEIFKNAFVHGNNLSLDKPIFVYAQDGRLYITNVVNKENTSNYQKSLAVLANLTGVHEGHNFIKGNVQLEYEYSDINKLNTGDIYEASIKVGNISKNTKQSKVAIKDSNSPKVYDSLSKGIPTLSVLQTISDAIISIFSTSATTQYINYEFINDIKDVINNNKKDTDSEILTVKIINKNIDKDINSNIKLVNSGLKINGEIVWINKNKSEVIIYCKEQNYEEILPVAKSIVLKTINTNNIAEFCIDKRYNAPEITEIAGITTINSFVYNDLKENKISVASAIKDVNIMEQKASSLYSVSKGNQIFLEYEIKDDVSYNNFVNKVLAENLGFGYVIDIETVNKYGKDFEMILEQAKEEKNINIYIKGKDNQINFKRIENFNDIKTLEEKITETNFSENIPLIPAVKLFSLVDRERFTDKLAMLNKLAKLLFVKKEYNDDYVRDLANNADEKLLKEISNYGIEKTLNNLKENNFDDILNTILQSPVVKITFKKIEQNVSDTVKAEQLKTEFAKTIAVRTILYNLSGNKMLDDKYRRNLKDIEELFIQAIKDENQFNRINIKDNKLSFDNEAIELIEEIKQKYGSSYSDIISLKNYDAITKLEYILNYLVDDRTKINKEENEFNTTMAMKALLSAA